MNKTLERQLRRYRGSAEIPEEWAAIFAVINETYSHFDEDRALLDRSLGLSSQEFAKIQQELLKENERIELQVRDRTRELGEERAKLNEIAEQMTTGAILLNSTGKPVFLNTAANRWLKPERIEDAVEKLIGFFPEAAIEASLKKALAGESVRIPEAEAQERIFAVSFSSLTSEAGIFGALIWIDDVTEQKLLDRSKSQFVAIAAHEMRTPLAIIRGNAELLLDEPGVAQNAETKAEVERVLKGAVRLLSIANDFLDVQNLEERKMVLKPTQFDVAALLQEIVGDLAKLADEKHVFLKLVLSPVPLPPVMLDRSRLQQVFINLISNAIHYTSEGGVTVWLEGSAGTIRAFIADTGAGMDADDQANLFKKFRTGKSFLRSKEYGSGLGLYISKMLAGLMGLTLRLEKSEVGKGTTFGLVIPLVAAMPAVVS